MLIGRHLPAGPHSYETVPGQNILGIFQEYLLIFLHSSNQSFQPGRKSEGRHGSLRFFRVVACEADLGTGVLPPCLKVLIKSQSITKHN